MDKLELVKTWSCSGCFLLKGQKKSFSYYLNDFFPLILETCKLENYIRLYVYFINFLGTLSRKELKDIDVRDHLNLEFSRRVGVKGFAYPELGLLIQNTD